jgi:hypothetical protein
MSVYKYKENKTYNINWRNESGYNWVNEDKWVVPSLNRGGGVMPNPWIWYQHVLPPLCGVFQLMSSPWNPESLLFPDIWDFLVATTHSHFPFPNVTYLSST